MKTLVFLLEEQSARNMLNIIVPKLTKGACSVQYITFEGKQDLERNMELKIREWRKPESRFIILRDKDSGDCKVIKRHLLNIVKRTRKENDCIVRIACHQLESFFLGDLDAVAQAMEMPNISNLKNKRIYRRPDYIANASEQLKKITNNKYRKILGSRKIAEFLHLDDRNKSYSFRILCSGIKRLASE